MTSLQKQLELLKAPQTDEYIQSKYKESFLYNRQDAASIDCETHLRVSNNGLDKLVEFDDNLEDFRDLFNEYSKDVERAVMTEGQNNQLSLRLRQFMNSTIVPYFTLNGCHETLEYLVYKYKVHSYQSDDLLAALLPYHDTRLFARALQMIPDLKKKRGVWDWMIPYQKEGLPIPKEKIVAIVVNKRNSGLLSLLGDKLIEINRDNKTNANVYTSFFATLVLEAMQRSPSEEFLSILFPHILKAMRKAYSIDLYMVGLTITGYLAHQISIEDTFLVRLMGRMTKSREKFLIKHPEKADYLNKRYLQTIVIICANQDDVELTDIVKDAIQKIDVDRYIGEFDCSTVTNQLLSRVIDMEE